MSNLVVSLDPDPAAPGDVVTATWTINNYHGQFDGVEVWLYLPEAFIPLEIGEGSFNPETNLLILPIHEASGLLSWFIDGNAQPPFDIMMEVHWHGQVILSVTRSLGERGPDFIPMAGGEAHGFNRHVKVNFPAGALPEDVDVKVRAPQNTELSLGGRPMKLTATGRASGMEITQFNQPVTITVHYTDEEAVRLLKNAGMKDESSLTLFYYDENQKTWYPLDTSVDTKSNQLTAITNHFSLFDYKAQNWEAARLPSLDGFQLSGFTGAATYSYPIQVPPGPGGLQPSLELSYNTQEVDSSSSRTQASWVGMGWSLDTGYIQRNMNGTPNYLGDDTYTLVMNGVGGLLLPIADQDGDPNTIDYHFANETFWRIRQYLASGDVGGYPGDHSKWVVFAPDGTQYYFGNYSDGSLGGHAWYPAYPDNICSNVTMQTWRWGLTRTRNIFGKEITYTYNYEMAPNQKYYGSCSGYPAAMYVAAYPDSIIYANNRYRVVFVREGYPNWVGNRTDYDTAWNAAQSTMLYMRSKLLRVEVWQDPNGTWNSGDEILIRKYVLGYGENGQQIFPNVTWTAGGKTPTLTSLTEYGLNGTTALPAVTFIYDNMHLDEVKNGYGGNVSFGYDNWHAEGGDESYLFDPDGVQYGTGEWYPDTFNENELDLMKQYFQPGVYYKIVAEVWPTAGGSSVQLGLDDGMTHVYGDVTNLTWAQWNTVTSYVVISEAASQARALFKCNGGCTLGRYEVFPLVTRYRITSKTITDYVTNTSYTYTYAYEGAAVNDTTHSAYVAADPSGAHLMTKPNTEFRGHSHVTETDPDGRKVETWYSQDDIYKGQAYKTLVTDSAGNIYTESDITFANQVNPTDNLPHPEGQPADSDLKVIWVYTTVEESRTYDGDSTYVASRNEYQYLTSDQGGTQYGNRTRTISSSWTIYGWYTYRGTRSEYYPKISNGTPENSRYLTGLPAYHNSYACNGGCDWELADLVSSFIRMFDGHANFYNPPDNGIVTGERDFILFNTPPLGDPRYADTGYTYDAWGNRTSVTQYNGYGAGFGSGGNPQIAYTCYGGGGSLNGHACSDDGYYTYPAWERNALDQLTTFIYDTAKSVPQSLTDPNGAITSATYDNFGRILTIMRPGDSSQYPTAKMSYHTASAPFLDNPFWTEAQQRITGSTYFIIRKYYDGIGQLLQTQVVGAAIGTLTRDILTDTFYDSAGRVYQQTVPYDMATGSYYHIRSTNAARTTTSYDILGRIANSLATDGTPTTYLYWDWYDYYAPVMYSKVTNPRGYSTTTESDIWGRVVSVTPPTGPTVSYTYDAADRLLTTTRGGSITTLNYDFGGRKTSMIDPDMGTWSYTYDVLGNMLTQTDSRSGGGCITTLGYDPLNRLTNKTYSGNCGTTTASVTYTYDSGTNGIGHRTGMSDGSGSTSWIYDSRERMTQETKAITGSGTFKTQWGYNSADLVSSMNYPGDNNNNNTYAGEVVNYTYLNQLLLDTIIGTNTYVNNTDYDAAGRVDVRDLGLSSGNPVIRMDYTYFNWTDVNGQGRLKQITSGIIGNLTSLQDLRYTYDAMGNVLTIQDYKAGNPQTQTFTYDWLDRLTSGQASGGSGGTYTLQNYTYSSSTGNLSSRGTVNYTYGDSNHKHAVTAMSSGESYVYDANGNQTQRVVGGSTYNLTYDAENHLVSVSGAVIATFYYDGDGNRVKATIGTTTITYIGNYFEWKTSTSDMKKYYYEGSIRVAMRTGSSTINYLLGDHLGSTAITTNSSGSRTAEIRYYPWGTTRYMYGSSPTTFQYTGQRLQSEIGLYFYNARWFDPSLARFIQPDSIVPGGAQGLDRYAYSSNNPVKYTDPTGHWPDIPDWLNPFTYDTLTISTTGFVKVIAGVEINISVSIDIRPIREGYKENGINGVISGLKETDITANAKASFSAGVSGEGALGLTVTGSDGGVFNQNGVDLIGHDGVPINYSVVLPPGPQSSGVAIIGSTTLNPNSDNGFASSQTWGLGGGIGYVDVSGELASASDWFYHGNYSSKTSEWKFPFFNKDFRDNLAK